MRGFFFGLELIMLVGRRYRTKKERLRMEKAGLPYCPDGSLDYGERTSCVRHPLLALTLNAVEDPFSILSILVPEPLTRLQLTPLYPSQTQTPFDSPSTPVNIPTPPYPPPPATKTAKRKYWNVNRYNPQRVHKNKEKEEEDNIPPLQIPRDAHTLDFGPYAGLVGTLAEGDVRTFLGSENSIVDAIRRSADEHTAAAAVDKPGQDEYWNTKAAAEAQGYLRDVVYGGLEGLAYVRSLAEFVSPPVECPTSSSFNPNLIFFFVRRLKRNIQRRTWGCPSRDTSKIPSSIHSQTVFTTSSVQPPSISNKPLLHPTPLFPPLSLPKSTARSRYTHPSSTRSALSNV